MVSRYVPNYTITNPNGHPGQHNGQHVQPLNISLSAAVAAANGGPGGNNNPVLTAQSQLQQLQQSQHQQQQNNDAVNSRLGGMHLEYHVPQFSVQGPPQQPNSAAPSAPSHPQYRIVHSRSEAYHVSASSGSYSSGHAQQQVQQSIRTLSTGTPPSQPPQQQQQQQTDIKMSQQSQPISMHTYPPARPLYRPVTGNQSSTRGNTRPAYLFPQGQQIMVPYSAPIRSFNQPQQASQTMYTSNAGTAQFQQPISYFNFQPFYHMPMPNQRGATPTPTIQPPSIVQTTLAQPQMTIQPAAPPAATPASVEPIKKVRRKNAMVILNPQTGENVLDQYFEDGMGTSTASSSIGSNAITTSTNSLASSSSSCSTLASLPLSGRMLPTTIIGVNQNPTSIDYDFHHVNNTDVTTTNVKPLAQLKESPNQLEPASNLNENDILVQQQHQQPPPKHIPHHNQHLHHPQQTHLPQQHHPHHNNSSNHNRANQQQIVSINNEYSSTTTPVVSANSDGPSVEIKQKKKFPPEIPQMPQRRNLNQIPNDNRRVTTTQQSQLGQHQFPHQQQPHHQQPHSHAHNVNLKKPHHNVTTDSSISNVTSNTDDNQNASAANQAPKAVDYSSMDSKDISVTSAANKESKSIDPVHQTSSNTRQTDVTTGVIQQQQAPSTHQQSQSSETVLPYIINNNNKNNTQKNKELREDINIATSNLNPIKAAFIPSSYVNVNTTKIENSNTISTAASGNVQSTTEETSSPMLSPVTETTISQLKQERDYTETTNVETNNDKISSNNLNNNFNNNEVMDKNLIITPPSIDETDKSSIVNNNNNNSLIDSNNINDILITNELNNNVDSTDLVRTTISTSTQKQEEQFSTQTQTKRSSDTVIPTNIITKQSSNNDINIIKITPTTTTIDGYISKDLPSSIVNTNINNNDNSNIDLHNTISSRVDSNSKTEGIVTEQTLPVNITINNHNEEQELPQNVDDVKPIVASSTTVDISSSAESSLTVTSSPDVDPNIFAATAAVPAVPLIEYDSKQWSPFNPEGKKYYSRDQLIKLRTTNGMGTDQQPDVLSVLKAHKPMQIPSKSGSMGSNMNSSSGGHHHNMYQQKSFGNASDISIMPKFGNRNTYTKRSQGNPGSGSTGGNNIGINANKLSQGNMSMGNPNMNHVISMGGSNSMNRDGSTNKNQFIKLQLQLNEDIKLNVSENAWKPKHLVGEIALTEEEKKTEDLFKRFRSILNKLTPENFMVLVSQVNGLNIDSVIRLDGCIDLVFEKAISEPNFSVAYAQMCKEIGVIYVPTDEDKQKINFKTKLILQCQKEFSKHSSDNKTDLKDASKMDESPELDKAEEMKLQHEEEIRKMRHRAVGTVRFIGELYKIDMLNARIMHQCVKLLLGNEDEESLECLCKLLTTIGGKLELSSTKNTDFSKYFEQLLKIVQRKSNIKVSSRIRFMIQDLIDLKNNKWQPRRADLNPKTMTQIAKEAETEMITTQFMNYHSHSNSGGGSQTQSGSNQSPSNSGSRNKDDRRGGGGINNNGGNNSGNGGNNNNNGRGGVTNEEGWLTKQTFKKNLTIDPKKISYVSTSNNENETKLGSASNYQIFNRFAALQETTTSSSNALSSGASAPSNKNKDSYHSKSSMEQDRYHHTYDGRRSGGSMDMRGNTGNMNSRNNSRENSRSRSSMSNNMSSMSSRSLQPSSSTNRPMHQQQPPSQQHHHHQSQHNQQSNIPPHTINNRDQQSGGASTSLIGLRSDGYSSLQSQTINPAMKSSSTIVVAPSATGEKSAPGNLSSEQKFNADAEIEAFEKLSKTLRESSCEEFITEFVIKFKLLNAADRCDGISKLLYCNIDNSDLRKKTTLLIISLIKEELITRVDLLKGLKSLLDQMEDLVLDMPHVWKYTSEILGMLMFKKLLSFRELSQSSSEVVKSELGECLLIELFNTIVQEYGPSILRNLWRESKSDWTLFMDQKCVQSFIENNKLEYISNSKIEPSGIQKTTDINMIKTKVHDFLESNATVDNIFDWISVNVVASTTSDKQFIRAYTRVVIEHFIGKNKAFDPTPVDVFTTLLKKYIDNRPEREFQCLLEIQSIIYEMEHPARLLSTIFGHLYDEEIISESSFNEWETTDEEVSKGKGVALKSCTSFFTHMKETDSSEDESADN